jgi:hypothetical protein
MYTIQHLQHLQKDLLLYSLDGKLLLDLNIRDLISKKKFKDTKLKKKNKPLA